MSDAPSSEAPYLPTMVGGALPLDFANTLPGRGTPYSRERLVSLAALADWAFHAGQIDALMYARIRAAPDADKPPPPEAIRLREAVHAIVTARIAGEAPPEADTALLRDCAALGMRRGRFVSREDGRLDWQVPASESDVEWLLGRIALLAIEMLRQSDPARLRCCPAPDCGFLFYDSSKSGTRRWCDMAVCGNRAKARAFRTRPTCD
ncbi:MAG: CGNR zinc finger domain-containing protein [Proteobacteria bacterium]|nr:CGNR zinc finger domain-containing protein [Pseudomonadota bacterium]